MITYLATAMAALAFAHLSGFGILTALGYRLRPTRLAFFTALLAGLTAVITGYSLLMTLGVSINSGFLLLGALAIGFGGRDRGKKMQDWQTTLSLYPEMLLVLSLIFLQQFLTIRGSGAMPLLFPATQDIVIFTDLANFLNHAGVENSQVDYVFTNTIGVALYHYFEIWLTALISRVAGLPSLYVDHLVTAALGGAVVYAGFTAILERFSKSAVRWRILCFALVLLNAEFLPPFLGHVALLGRSLDYFNLSAVEYVKFFPIYMFLQAATLALLYERRDLSCLAVLGATIASGLVTPAFYATLVALLILGSWRRRLASQEARRMVLATTSCLVWSVAFYKIFKGAVSFSTMPQWPALVSYFAGGKGVRTAINVIGGSLLQCLALMSPWLALGFCVRRCDEFRERAVRDVAWLYGMIFLVGLLEWAALHFMLVSHQVFTRGTHVLLNLAALLVMVLASRRASKVLVLVLLVVTPFKLLDYVGKLRAYRATSLAAYDSQFVERAAKQLAGLNPLGVHFRGRSEYSGASLVDKLPNQRPGGFLGMLGSHFYPTSLTPFEIPVSSDPMVGRIESELRRSYPFYKFVEAQKSSGTFTGVAESQVKFMAHYQIEYGIVSRAAQLPAALVPLVKSSLTDPRSGDTLVLFKPQAH